MNVHFRSDTDNYSTPISVYDALNKEFNFNDDPCPLTYEIIGSLFNNDGLYRPWGTSTFCNPPYSKIKEFIKKGYDESRLGKTVVFLIPSRTDTRWWHDFVMKAKEIRFIKGRLKFGNSKNSAPFPSCIVVFSEPSVQTLK